MSDNLFFAQQARNAYSKFTKGVINFFSLSKEPLKNFFEIQKINNATLKYSLGIKEVPLEKIVGSMEKTRDFNRDFVPLNPVTEVRWCNIYTKFMEDGNLPVVSLYKIKDEYFVHDGHHRISVAKYLNLRTIEAEVTEFLPNNPSLEDSLYREMFFFQLQTGLDRITFLYRDGYEALLQDIRKFQSLSGLQNESLHSVAKLWKKCLFSPVTKLLRISDLFNDIPNGHLYMKILNYQKKFPEKGYLESLMDITDYYDFVLSESIRRKISKIESFDHLLDKNMDFLKKVELLSNYSGIEMKMCPKIIKEISEYPHGSSFQDKLSVWYHEKFIFRYSIFEKNILLLPIKYRKPWILIDNPEKLTLEFIKYQSYFQNRYTFKLTSMEIVLQYIIEIYLPLINELEDNPYLDQLYYPVSKSYRRLLTYSKRSSISKAVILLKNNEHFLKFFSGIDKINHI